MSSHDRSYQKAMTLAAITGARSMLGPAFLSVSRGSPSKGAWIAAALGEMVLDKLGILPSRSRPLLLIPRAIAGAWVARESLKDDGIDDPRALAMGAAMAVGVAIAMPNVRFAANKVLGVPDAFLGAAEDYLALNLGAEVTNVPVNELPAIAREAVEGLGTQLTASLPAGYGA